MKYVGLTNDPEIVKNMEGNPCDWWQRNFSDESEAYRWFKTLLKIQGYKEMPKNKDGWKYGYTFSISFQSES